VLQILKDVKAKPLTVAKVQLDAVTETEDRILDTEIICNKV
jgi:hypothetical protein